jgi:RNA polymerase sigma-70 factor, ECF subfamily
MNSHRNADGFRTVTSLNDSDEDRAQTRLAVLRAKEGDRDAISLLYSHYSGNVYGYVRSIVRDDHDAEDVTQHVFAKLITVLSKYDERGDVPFSAWLLRMARNAAIDHLRVSRRSVPVEDVFDVNTGTSPDSERSVLVRDAFAALPEDQRSVMVLRHIIGLSPTEIADRLGRTEASVHGLQHRGRRALQHELTLSGSTPVTRRSATRRSSAHDQLPVAA